VKFRVHRPNWLRGQGDGSLLRNGARCCLGFLAKAAGFSDDDMRNFSELTELIDHLDHLGSPHIDGLACVEQVVIDVNDPAARGGHPRAARGSGRVAGGDEVTPRDVATVHAYDRAGYTRAETAAMMGCSVRTLRRHCGPRERSEPTVAERVLAHLRRETRRDVWWRAWELAEALDVPDRQVRRALAQLGDAVERREVEAPMRLMHSTHMRPVAEWRATSGTE
jgi:AraC-like DNA-binding protein